MSSRNAFDPLEIQRIKDLARKRNQLFVPVEDQPFDEDEAYFYFIGLKDGKEAVYNAYMYSLEAEYLAKLMEEAELKVQEKYPDFDMESQDWLDDSDDNAPLELFDEYVEELSEDPNFGVREFVQEHDEGEEGDDFGIGLDVCLNVTAITNDVINDFIRKFQEGDEYPVDSVIYSFDIEEEED